MTKLTCMILSLLLIVCAVPTIPVWAEDTATVVQESTVTEATATSNPEVEPAAPTTGSAILSAEGVISTDATVGTVTEVTSLREESIKHFKLPDGTYQAVIYADAVHRKDAAGQWQNIDNRLYLSQDSKSNTETYRTTDGRTSFAKSYAANQEIFSLSEDGYAVSVSMISNQLTLEPVVGGELVTQAAGTTAAAPAASTVTVTNAPAKANPNATEWASIEAARAAVGGDDGSIVYTNVAPHTDLEYVLQGNDIKENIIVKATALSYVYRFRLELTGLTATLTDNGSVSLRDATGTERLTIPVPYMYDATGATSYAVTYGLATNTDGSYTLTVTADPTWINDADRVFPVTIDPCLNKYGTFIDTYVSQDAPTANYSNSTTLRVGESTGRTHRYTALMRFPFISTLAAGYQITQADLYMTYYYDTGATSGSMGISVYDLLRDWDASTITWEQYYRNMSLGHIIADAQYLDVSGATQTTPRQIWFDISQYAKWWYNGTTENYGIALSYYGGGTETSVVLNSNDLNSYEYSPHVILSYELPIDDGVYALENRENDGMWMDIRYNSPFSGRVLQQYDYTTSPVTAFENGGMFKITNVPNTPHYVIRCMTNNLLGLGISGNQIQTVIVPSNDSQVPLANRFILHVQNDGSIVLQPCSLNKVVSAPNSLASGSAGAPDSNLIMVSDTDYDNHARWRLDKYEDQNYYHIELSKPSSWADSGGIDINGGSGVATVVAWSTRVGVNQPQMEIRSSPVVSLTWDASSGRVGYLPGDLGSLLIPIYMKDANGTTVHTSYEYFPVIPSEGTYFIRNVGSERYIDIEGPSLSEGAAIHEWEFHGNIYEQWIVEHVAGEDGYVRIKSAYSGLYIGVDPMNSQLIKQYDDLTDYTLWQFITCTSGNIRICSSACGGVLGLPTSSTISGTNLTRIPYFDNAAYLDEWEMYKCKLQLETIVYYDTDCQYFPDQLSDIYSEAFEAFLLEFGINFKLGAVLYSSLLDLKSCSVDEMDSTCLSACGLDSQCDTNHHRNASRLLYLLGTDYTYSMRIVEYGICCVYNNTHQGIEGLGTVGSNRSIVSVSFSRDLVYTIQHEITHNFGRGHYTCTAGQACVLEGTRGEWCNACSQFIRNMI